MEKLTLHEKNIIHTVFIAFWTKTNVDINKVDKAFESLTGEKLSSEKYKDVNGRIDGHFFSFLHGEPDEVIIPVVVNIFEMAQAYFEKLVSNKYGIISEYSEAKQIVASMKEHQKIKDEEIAKSNYFENSDIDSLQLDDKLAYIIKQRIQEIRLCIPHAPLAAILLCGSVLEGVLLDIAQKNPQKFNQARCSPKDKDSKVKALSDWSLAQLIDVSNELGYLQHDTKKFSQTIRDFRNYIHPRQQGVENFTPTLHTAEICCKVLVGAINDIKSYS